MSKNYCSLYFSRFHASENNRKIIYRNIRLRSFASIFRSLIIHIRPWSAARKQNFSFEYFVQSHVTATLYKTIMFPHVCALKYMYKMLKSMEHVPQIWPLSSTKLLIYSFKIETLSNIYPKFSNLTNIIQFYKNFK